MIRRVRDFIMRIGSGNLFSYKHWEGYFPLAHLFQIHINPKKGAPRVLRWEKPSSHRYKLNTDGAALSSISRAAGGGILRDDGGKIIWCYSNWYGQHTAIYAETKALYDGLRFCCERRISNIDIETDSSQLKDMIQLNSVP